MTTTGSGRKSASSPIASAVTTQAEAVLDGTIDGYISVDSEARVVAWNQAAERMYGWTREEALGLVLTDLIVPGPYREAASEGWRQHWESQSEEMIGRVSETWGCRRDRSVFPVEIALSMAGTKEQPEYQAFHRDITARRDSEAALARASMIVESSQDATAAIDRDGVVTAWNPAFERLCGVPAADAVGRRFADVLPIDEFHRLAAFLKDPDAPISPKIDTKRQVHPDGSATILTVQLTAIVDSNGVVEGLCGIMRDVTELAKAEQRERKAVQRLRAIIENMDAAISVRDAEFHYVLVNRAYCELLDLPPEDDITGKTDIEVLGTAAVDRHRAVDARVLAGESVTQEEVATVAGEERVLLTQWFPLARDDGRVESIVGMATDITHTKRAEAELLEKVAWEERIRRAIAEQRLVVYSQPIIDISTGALAGEELLVRMHDQKGSPPDMVVAPDDFLPQAERFGLMPMIDLFMIGEAITLAESGRRVSVNVTATTLHLMAEQIINMIKASPGAAPFLTLEITETIALASPDLAHAFAEELDELGVGLALDDFGTGYGSISELRDLKLTNLKIDLRFVRNLVTSVADQRVVKLIIHIAHEFGLTTTAEGVEAPEALELLREYGADRAQGHLIARAARLVPGRPAISRHWIGDILMSAHR